MYFQYFAVAAVALGHSGLETKAKARGLEGVKRGEFQSFLSH